MLLSYALHLISRKNYTEAEITRKLLRRSEKLNLQNSKIAQKKVLKRLCELTYIDDTKILGDYFEYRLPARPQGKFAFLNELQRRGIPIENAKAEWEKRGIREESLAMALIKNKKMRFAKMPRVLQEKKIASLLANRGFSPETIWEILEKMSRHISIKSVH